MVSFEDAALFPSVPIATASSTSTTSSPKTLTYTNARHSPPLTSQTSSDFFYNDRHHTTKDSGPIGLSLMVLVSQIWMSYTMDSAIDFVRQRLLAIPRHIFIYMDDTWCVIKTPPTPRAPACTVAASLLATRQRILGNVSMRYAPVYNSRWRKGRKRAFLDVHITRHDDGALTTRIFRKPSNTNIV